MTIPDWLIGIGIFLVLAACALGVLYFWPRKKGSP